MMPVSRHERKAIGICVASSEIPVLEIPVLSSCLTVGIGTTRPEPGDCGARPRLPRSGHAPCTRRDETSWARRDLAGPAAHKRQVVEIARSRSWRGACSSARSCMLRGSSDDRRAQGRRRPHLLDQPTMHSASAPPPTGAERRADLPLLPRRSRAALRHHDPWLHRDEQSPAPRRPRQPRQLEVAPEFRTRG
jgi:hypothetical protein